LLLKPLRLLLLGCFAAAAAEAAAATPYLVAASLLRCAALLLLLLLLVALLQAAPWLVSCWALLWWMHLTLHQQGRQQLLQLQHHCCDS
jgi:hypothetical protein